VDSIKDGLRDLAGTVGCGGIAGASGGPGKIRKWAVEELAR